MALDLHRLFPTRHLWSERWHGAGTTAARRPEGACGDTITATSDHTDASAMLKLLLLLMLVNILMLVLKLVLILILLITIILVLVVPQRMDLARHVLQRNGD